MDRDILEKTKQLRHELHRHPELSGCEKETIERIKAFLSEEPALDITDMGDRLYACFRCGRQDAETIAFRADMDALPIDEYNNLPYCSQNAGVSHRCGHDGHTATLAGAALQLARNGSACDVWFIFQPSEETGTGGRKCAGLIDEKSISEVYAFHNWSGFPEKNIVLKTGTAMCASKGLTIKFTGRASHASKPEDGVNPAFALGKLMEESIEFSEREPWKGDVLLTVVGINAGGENFGIAPGEGTLSMTLRAEKEAEMEILQEKICEEADRLAKVYGLSAEICEKDVFPETSNDAELCAKAAEAAGRLGLETVSMDKPHRSSEDFGWYQKKCPGVIFFVGNGCDYPQIHTEKYDFNDRIIETAVDMFCELAK